MFLTSKVQCALLRSEERRSASVSDGVSAPPNEAGGGEGLSYKHVAPLGQGSAANFGTVSSSFSEDQENTEGAEN